MKTEISMSGAALFCAPRMSPLGLSLWAQEGDTQIVVGVIDLTAKQIRALRDSCDETLSHLQKEEV